VKLHRRQFLQTLLSAGIAAQSIDIEKLLWVPGEKRIFIPPIQRDSIIGCPGDFYVGEMVRFGMDPTLYRVTSVSRNIVDVEPWSWSNDDRVLWPRSSSSALPPDSRPQTALLLPAT
jgi:hypothetical protein